MDGLFAELSRRKLQRGVFHSVVALQTASKGFVTQHNQSPTPFVWRADPKDVIAAVKREHQALQTIPLHFFNRVTTIGVEACVFGITRR